jgi:hypothetical protein
MPNYANTIIYKLINYDYPDLVYVGSTTNFTKRKQQHKSRCNNESNSGHELKVYKVIRENGGWQSWTMVQICDFPCETKIEAIQEEDRHMLELKASLNSQRAMRTREQYYIEHKETIALYRLANKDKIAIRTKKYYEDEDNLEKRRMYLKKYNIDNKDKINAKRDIPSICVCGSNFTPRHITRHCKTKKHINFINQPIEQ